MDTGSSNKFSTGVIINAEPAKVWALLTEPPLMVKWMGQPEMSLEVHTGWGLNTPIVIRGFHHTNFEAKGLVLQYEQGKVLSYSQLSSISRLPDKPENYTVLEFVLTSTDNQTALTINIRNFPTEVIRKHLEFYWRTAIVVIKRILESET